MTIIHMEVELARELVQRMKLASGDLSGEIISLRRAKENLDMNWSGDSATQFVEELQSWIARFNQEADIALTNLAGRLEREIAEWEQADASFGAGSAAGLSGVSPTARTAGAAAGVAAGAAAGGAVAGVRQQRVRDPGTALPPASNKGGSSTGSAAAGTQQRVRNNTVPATARPTVGPKDISPELGNRSAEDGIKVDEYLQTPRGRGVYGELPPETIAQIPSEVLLDKKITRARMEGNSLILTTMVGRYVRYRNGSESTPRPVDTYRINILSEAERTPIGLPPEGTPDDPWSWQDEFIPAKDVFSERPVQGSIGLPGNDPSVDPSAPLPDFSNLDLPPEDQIQGFGQEVEGFHRVVDISNGAEGGIGLPRNDPSVDRRSPLPDLSNVDLSPEPTNSSDLGVDEGYVAKNIDLNDK